MELQLVDYSDGYRFRMKCRPCGYGWYADPKDILAQEETHERMYLEEVAQQLRCPACHRFEAVITPIIIIPKHHFVGGMA